MISRPRVPKNVKVPTRFSPPSHASNRQSSNSSRKFQMHPRVRSKQHENPILDLRPVRTKKRTNLSCKLILISRSGRLRRLHILPSTCVSSIQHQRAKSGVISCSEVQVQSPSKLLAAASVPRSLRRSRTSKTGVPRSLTLTRSTQLSLLATPSSAADTAKP